MSIYKKIKDEAFKNGLKPKTVEAREWYRNRVKNMFSADRQQVFRETKSEYSSLRKFIPGRIRYTPGTIMMFFYDAKYKDTLPYWDKFPLIVAMDYAKGGFTGLNLHYLPPDLRGQLMDALMDITNNNKFDESTRIKASYKLLAASSKYDAFKPCFKRYLWNHTKSQFAVVNPEDWEIAAFLPLAHWQKQTSWQVFHDSRKMVG